MSTNSINETFDGYTTHVPSEPSYYGSNCTQEDATRIASSLAGIIRGEFPGITVEVHPSTDTCGKTTGPNPEVVDDINRWIEENWTAAL